MNKLLEIRRIAADFQSKLYKQYLEHVGMIQAMDLDVEVDGEMLVIEPAEAALKAAKESVLNETEPDLITNQTNE